MAELSSSPVRLRPGAQGGGLQAPGGHVGRPGRIADLVQPDLARDPPGRLPARHHILRRQGAGRQRPAGRLADHRRRLGQGKAVACQLDLRAREPRRIPEGRRRGLADVVGRYPGDPGVGRDGGDDLAAWKVGEHPRRLGGDEVLHHEGGLEDGQELEARRSHGRFHRLLAVPVDLAFAESGMGRPPARGRHGGVDDLCDAGRAGSRDQVGGLGPLGVAARVVGELHGEDGADAFERRVQRGRIVKVAADHLRALRREAPGGLAAGVAHHRPHGAALSQEGAHDGAALGSRGAAYQRGHARPLFHEGSLCRRSLPGHGSEQASQARTGPRSN